MSGVVGGVQVTEGLMLVGGIMIAVPLLIIPLTQFLTFKANRRANLFMGGLMIVNIIGTNMVPDLDNIFFAVIEIAALLLILRLAWNWKEDTA
jgi:predicted tellurium resistance membrane protein TerC